MKEVVLHLDDIDNRMMEIYLDNLRKVMNLPKMTIEDAILFCIKRSLYNEDKVDPKGTGH